MNAHTRNRFQATAWSTTKVSIEPDDSSVLRVRMSGLLGMLDEHDPGSTAHAEAVGRVARFLTLRATGNEAYADTVADAARFHDVGKLLVPGRILHKPGGLDASEWITMRQHAQAGKALLLACGCSPEHVAVRVALAHHERFDGGGYPSGLRAGQIDLAARIVAVSDVFDALLSRRCYKPAWPLERVLSHLRSERGTAFDPDLVDVLSHEPEQTWEARQEISRFSGSAQELRTASALPSTCRPFSIASCAKAA